MQVTAKSIMLEQYNKLLKNDTSSIVRSAKESANPLLVGSKEDSLSSSSAIDKVQISQEAISMLENYSTDDASIDAARRSALEKVFQLTSESLNESGKTNLEAIIAAIEEKLQEGEANPSLLSTLADVNKEANAGKGYLNYSI